MANPETLSSQELEHLARHSSSTSTTTTFTSTIHEASSTIHEAGEDGGNDNYYSIPITRDRTAATTGFDSENRTVLERQRTAESIYRETVGEDDGDGVGRGKDGRVGRGMVPTGSYFARMNSMTPRDQWPEFGGGKAYPPLLSDKDDYVVDFTGPKDPLHGQNWPLRKKITTAAVLGFATFVCAWGSSIYSSATFAVSREWGVSSEVALLGMSTYVLGFAFGPLIWAPFSELRGRRLPLFLGIFGFSIFQIGAAVAKDIQTIILCRFFGGIFASCPLSIVGAVFADIFGQETRGTAMAVFSMMVFSGPLFGPIAGGFIISSNLGWRWTQYITALMGFLALFLCLLFLEETYPPVILIQKAAHLRRVTKNWGIHAKQEEISVDFSTLVRKNLSRPIKLLFTEPIILMISLYTAFVYAILYLFLVSYPIVFATVRGWSPGIAALPYLGMVTGMFLGGSLVIAFQPWTNHRATTAGHVVPEDRLVPCIIGSIFFPIGLFWFSWSGANPDIHWIVPTLAGIPFGLGLITINLQCLNYLIDAYLTFSASAIAANTFLRSLLAAGFPLFGRFLFEPKPKGKLGIGWAGSLLGFLAVLMIPIPVLLFWKGEGIRRRSKWAPNHGVKDRKEMMAEKKERVHDPERRQSAGGGV